MFAHRSAVLCEDALGAQREYNVPVAVLAALAGALAMSKRRRVNHVGGGIGTVTCFVSLGLAAVNGPVIPLLAVASLASVSVVLAIKRARMD